MFNHTKAVRGAVKKALVVADMPYVCYQINRKKAVSYARAFVEEAGADAVKLEWFTHCGEVTKNLIKNNIPVMGHIGLTPQTVDKLGGFRVQGRLSEQALKLMEQACFLEEVGIFSLVLECVPQRLAALITQRLKIPTIGIGAGGACDGQVLVLYDMLGLYKKITPKFVRVYLDAYSTIIEGVKKFIADIKQGAFPGPAESFHMKEEEFKKLRALLKERAK